jgi:predicted nucleic acid-binding protein
VETRTAIVNEWLEAIDLVLLRSQILRRAAHPLPTPLGTLDAIHLATALAWRDVDDGPLTVVTHDASLDQAARAFGLAVVGV